MPSRMSQQLPKKKQQIPNEFNHNLLHIPFCFQRMASIGGNVMLQQRLPVQQLFNNNRQQPISTNNYRLGSTKNYQQMTRNHRPQIAKQHQIPSSAHIGENSFMSTGSKYHQQHVNVDVTSQFNMLTAKCIRKWKDLSIAGQQGTPRETSKTGFLHIHKSQSLSFIVISVPKNIFSYFVVDNTDSTQPTASSYGEKDHFTKTIFVSTSTTKVMYLYLYSSLYLLLSLNLSYGD